jgi:type IV pilus assembly protein PilY1
MLAFGTLAANLSPAQQITFSEDFTGPSSTNAWYYFGGACLTAGTGWSIATPGASAAPIPGCTSVLASYYNKAANADPYLVGGDGGFLGANTAPGSVSGQVPDPIDSVTHIGRGALRFTNGSQNIAGSNKYGHNERGAILSSNTFPTGSGIQVTFKTVTYHGDSGGAGGDGADGISFFLQDGTQAPGLGAFGGSLAYSCANNNIPYDGLTGGYLGLGIDEYGNFLNGSNVVVGYSGTNTATGDNAAYGYGYKPGRIGLRGAGNISTGGLTAAYGSDPGDPTKPYYPVSLASSCNITGGTYNSATNNCINICSAGSTFYAPTGLCQRACTGTAVYDPGSNSCQSCSSVGGTYNSGQCTNTTSCAAGTYFSGTTSCDTCPATGYASGTYSSGNCIRSCPSGYTYNSTTPGYCVPTGATFSATSFRFCATGYSFSGTTLCFPTGASQTTGNYCPTGYTITGALCYPTGASQTGGNYCPTGYVITGTVCYPTGASQAGGKYCPAGQTISGALCFPTTLPALSHTTTAYCGTGLTINGAFCYPAGVVISAPNYCPTGNTISTTHCCPAGYSWNAGANLCKSGALIQPGTTASVAGAATAMSAANTDIGSTPETAATVDIPAAAAPAAQIVAANQSATQNTTPVPSAPATLSPSTGIVDAEYAVQNTCRTGNLFNYRSVSAPTSAGPATLANPVNTKRVLDYAPILNAYKEVTSFQIANEGAMTRAAATPIFYNLKITQDGLLSFAYSVSGGAYSYLIKDQSITASNGPLPTSFRVGFAASDGGASNVHEIMCFKAASTTQSGSSATVNEKEAAKVEAGTQAYFAFYNPNNWTGTVTANTLLDDGTGVVSVATTANWDAACLLSGAPTGTPPNGGCSSTNTAGPTTPRPAPASRVMITWDTVNSVGIPFEWVNLNSAQQGALTFGDGNFTGNRLDYLRGTRSNEINTSGVGLYRARDSILGDIVDSSPNWVGPPQSPYTARWRDRLLGGNMPENAGTQSYLQYAATEQTRLNVVYVGSNDGFLHGFRAGSFDSIGNFVDNGTTPNDGAEVLAYMPGASLVSTALSSATGGCTNDISTETVVQNIHGVTPAVGMNSACSGPLVDFSNSQYGHNFFIDATPGSGELFYGGRWHTWLVGGLGVGGAAIYALDVTDPASFSEGNASSIAIGEWTASSISCALVSNCGNNLGNTFGTPQIRRLHNGNWAIIFGNGFGSASGDAGIYVMSIDTNSGTPTTYYLSTHNVGGNGIAYTTPADLDGDHITDYVYAGDLQGNVWRFDLTGADPATWAAGAAPMFSAQSGQPITSELLVIAINTVGSPPRLMIEFGTGQRTQITNLAPEQFIPGGQSIYGVWDWNLSAWNALETGAPYAALDPATSGIGTPFALSSSNLASQTLTANTNGTVDGTNAPVCWQGGTSLCTGANNQFGWYANLPTTGEQVIFNPVFFSGAFVVNTTVPANNLATTCDSTSDSGYTYALSVNNGGVFTNTFPTFTMNGTLITDPIEAGVATNAAGSVYVVNTTEGKANVVYQTISGTPGAQRINIPSNIKAKRLTWIEQR